MTKRKEELTMASTAYTYKKLDSPEGVTLEDLTQPPSTWTEDSKAEPLPNQSTSRRHSTIQTVIFTMVSSVLLLVATLSLVRAAWFEKRATTTASSSSTTTVPQYFQTTPEIFAGKLLYTQTDLESSTNRDPRSNCHW